jgi:CheY-like chemotaxis protein
LTAQSARPARAKEGVTALVVDDSPISRALGVYLLSWHNIAADAVESGRMALAKLADRRYDLIFMDYSMPELNGIQTAALIRARERELPQISLIIGMSSCADSAENMEAVFLEAGMQGCLAKPVDPCELNLVLLSLLPRLHGQSAEAPERTDAPKPIDSPQASLIRTLSDIDGLDAEKGLANAGGSVDIYAGMLRRFTAELTEYIEPLLSLPMDGSWEEVATRLHVLQEFFIGIGMGDLARDAADLAAAADAGSGSGCMPRIQSFCDAMMRLRAKLVGLNAGNNRERIAGRREQKETRVEQVNLTTLRLCVSRLHDACLSYRAAEAQAAADGLRRIAAPEDMEDEIEAICALVDTLDYHEARERCARLLETTNPRKYDAAR